MVDSFQKIWSQMVIFPGGDFGVQTMTPKHTSTRIQHPFLSLESGSHGSLFFRRIFWEPLCHQNPWPQNGRAPVVCDYSKASEDETQTPGRAIRPGGSKDGIWFKPQHLWKAENWKDNFQTLRFWKNAAVCGRQEKYVAKYVHEVRTASRTLFL